MVLDTSKLLRKNTKDSNGRIAVSAGSVVVEGENVIKTVVK